jgi:hypothetical protein
LVMREGRWGYGGVWGGDVRGWGVLVEWHELFFVDDYQCGRGGGGGVDLYMDWIGYGCGLLRMRMWVGGIEVFIWGTGPRW